MARTKTSKSDANVVQDSVDMLNESEVISENRAVALLSTVKSSAQAAQQAQQELHPQHFAVLEEEMLTQWPLLETALTTWHDAPEDPSPPALLRALHTLKGSARLAGAQAWAQQVHALESGNARQGDLVAYAILHRCAGTVGAPKLSFFVS